MLLLLSRRYALLILLLSGLWIPAWAQPGTPAHQAAQDSSTAPMKRQLWSKAALLGAPVALVGYGAATMNRQHHVTFANDELREEAQETFPRFHTTLDDYTRYVPGVVALGLTAMGVPGQRRPVPFFITYELAHVLNAQLTNNLKHLAHEARPDGAADYSSFPSAHTSEAFMTATLLHEQYGKQYPWLSVGGFTLATATGAMRILNGRHWLSDVAAGAGIGVLSAEAVWHVYPWLANRLPGKLSHRLLLLPAYAPGGAAVLVALQP